MHTTVDLGRRLGMRVVAEGVETMEAWDLLAGLSCDEAQGFYPRAADDGHRAGRLDARPRGDYVNKGASSSARICSSVGPVS